MNSDLQFYHHILILIWEFQCWSEVSCVLWWLKVISQNISQLQILQIFVDYSIFFNVGREQKQEAHTKLNLKSCCCNLIQTCKFKYNLNLNVWIKCSRMVRHFHFGEANRWTSTEAKQCTAVHNVFQLTSDRSLKLLYCSLPSHQTSLTRTLIWTRRISWSLTGHCLDLQQQTLKFGLTLTSLKTEVT